jgi:hypothetical protein
VTATLTPARLAELLSDPTLTPADLLCLADAADDLEPGSGDALRWRAVMGLLRATRRQPECFWFKDATRVLVYRYCVCIRPGLDGREVSRWADGWHDEDRFADPCDPPACAPLVLRALLREMCR